MARVIVTVLLLIAAGCAPNALNIDRQASALSPEPSVYNDDIRRLGILEPDMFLYDVSAGGVFEYRDDWSRSASNRVMTSAALRLVAMGYDVAALPDIIGESVFFQIKTKMRYHSMAFQSASFARMNMILETDTLLYSLGSQGELCDAFGVDGFLYIYGFGEKLSEERRRIVGEDAEERTFMVAMLVDREGRVSWYRHLLTSGSLDMRNERHAMRMMGAILQ